MCRVAPGDQGDAGLPLWDAGRRPVQGERLRPHHRRHHPEVRAHARGAPALPGPGPLLQGRHLLQVISVVSLTLYLRSLV